MKKITELTRRDIFSLFKDGLDIVGFLDEERLSYKYYGRLDEIDFLKRYMISKLYQVMIVDLKMLRKI